MADSSTIAIPHSRQDQFAALLDRHHGIVLKVAATYCRDAEDRRDLAQDISAQLWRAFPAYDPQRSFSTWMYRIALNVAISQVRSEVYRRRYRHEPLDLLSNDVPAVGKDFEADAALRAMYRVIGTLGSLDRALMLLYLEERSHAEIGEVLGISESNVATRLHRLKQRIRVHFDQQDQPRGGDHGAR